jgi:hypothetical protein
MKVKRPGPVEVKKGEAILVEGETGKEMYIIEEGRVEIYRKANGGERRLGLLEAGDFFGEMGLLDDQPRTASARATVDTRLLLIDETTFEQILRRHPEVSIRIMRSLCKRLRAAAAGGPAPPEPLPATRPAAVPGRLVPKPGGAEIPLPAKAEIRVGRFDAATKTEPDVDLAPFDTKRLTSRRHATILREEGELFLLEEIATANGTFVNDERIEAGVRVKVGDGDELRFGGVTFVLRVP